jgi:type VI secretion system protein ImpB
MSSGKDTSVAPKERVNITYKSQTGVGEEDVELPLKMLVLAELTGEAPAEPLAERKAINVDKNNFNGVMASQNVRLSAAVPDRISGSGELAVSLKFESLKDFEPEGIVAQVPELRRLLELRSALHALRGPLQNKAAFRKKVQELVGDPEARKRLMAELGLDPEAK